MFQINLIFSLFLCIIINRTNEQRDLLTFKENLSNGCCSPILLREQKDILFEVV